MLSNKTLDDDIEAILIGILKDMNEEEAEKPLEASAKEYVQIGKVITDSASIDFCLKKLKKANQKLIDEINIMEESARNEAEKQARDQAEAERNELMKKQLTEIYSSINDTDVADISGIENLESIKQQVTEVLLTRKQRLIQQKELLEAYYSQ